LLSGLQRFVDAREAHVLAALRGAVTACTLSPAEVGHIEQQASANGQLAAHLKKKVSAVRVRDALWVYTGACTFGDILGANQMLVDDCIVGRLGSHLTFPSSG